MFCKRVLLHLAVFSPGPCPVTSPPPLSSRPSPWTGDRHFNKSFIAALHVLLIPEIASGYSVAGSGIASVGKASRIVVRRGADGVGEGGSGDLGCRGWRVVSGGCERCLCLSFFFFLFLPSLSVSSILFLFVFAGFWCGDGIMYVGVREKRRGGRQEVGSRKQDTM